MIKMKKIAKRLLSLVLVGTTILSMSVVAMAAPAEDTSQEAKVIYVEGIEKFFSKNEDGTMSLDVQQAQEAGYSDDSIAFIQGNIKRINDAVLTQGAYLDDNFVATIYFVSPRAKGQSKVEFWATGMMLVYMNSDEAKDLYNLVGNLNFVGTIIDGLGLLTVAKPILSYACNVASYFSGIVISLYKAQINQARSNGTGIIMYVTPLPEGGTYVTFGAQ